MQTLEPVTFRKQETRTDPNTQNLVEIDRIHDALNSRFLQVVFGLSHQYNFDTQRVSIRYTVVPESDGEEEAANAFIAHVEYPTYQPLSMEIFIHECKTAADAIMRSRP